MKNYNTLIKNLETLSNKISNVNDQMDICDNEYELAQLATELDFLEMEHLVLDEYITKTIDKGRE